MRIPAKNAQLWLFPNFIKLDQSQQLFHYLHQSIPWQQDQIMMYGKRVDIPRLQAWFGDEQAKYNYSGLTLKPTAWLPVLDKIRHQLNQQCVAIFAQETTQPNTINTNVAFNSLLANCYRDNQDAVAWHSDDEPELGVNPVIASISLGASREFKMKHKETGKKLNIPLTSGSLLIMAGETQHCWQHAVLRSKLSLGPRINLTFRQIKV